MKLPTTPLITILCIINLANMLFPCASTAEFLPNGPSPYSFGPEGRSIEDLRDYGKPSEMASFLPNRPVAAHDKYGNKLYYTPGGKMTMRVALDGSMQVTAGNKTKEMDATGKLERTSEQVKGTNMVEVKDDKGTILGYQEMGLGGKVVKEYDYQGNVTKTNQYNKYGKSLEFSLDELTQTRTIFNQDGTPKVDVDFEGNEVAWYKQDDRGVLAKKVDIHGNTTYFDKHGNMTHTENYAGAVAAKYNYKTDDEGRYFLDTAVDILGSVTYYKNGKPQVEKSKEGQVLKEYTYDGQSLQYTFDNISKDVTWYDRNGKPLYTTNDGELSKEWLYNKGKTVGLWDEVDNSVTVYLNERQTVKLMVADKPTAEQLQEWIAKGYIQNSNAVSNSH